MSKCIYLTGENIHRLVPIVIKNSPSLSMFKHTFVQYIKCNDRFFAVIVERILVQKVPSKSIRSFTQTPFHFNAVSGKWIFHLKVFNFYTLTMIEILIFFTLLSPSVLKNLRIFQDWKLMKIFTTTLNTSVTSVEFLWTQKGL
jgi:hypothetical protein